MSVALARASSLEDAMMVDSWRPSSPEQQRTAAGWYSPTTPSMATTTTMETPATPEREPKRRCLSNNYSPRVTARAAMWQPHSLIPAPALAPASSLPDELLIYIFSSTNWAPCELAAAAARVCRRWLPAATEILYTSLSIHVTDVDGAQMLARTMWNAPHLRQIVRGLYVYLCIDPNASLDIDLDLESLLGWTALIPPEPGLGTLNLYTNVPGTTAVLTRAPALRAVRELFITGPTTASLLVIPHRLERLTVADVGPLAFPPLPHLRSSSISHSRITFTRPLPGLRMLELSHMDRTSLSEMLNSLHGHHDTLAPNLHTLSLSYIMIDSDTDTIPILIPPSIRALRVDLQLAVRLDTGPLAAVEELVVTLNSLRPYGGLVGTDLRLLWTFVSGCDGLKLVKLAGGNGRVEEEEHRESIRTYLSSRGGVQVDFVELDVFCLAW